MKYGKIKNGYAVIILIIINIIIFFYAKINSPSHYYTVYFPEDVIFEDTNFPCTGNKNSNIKIFAYLDFDCRYNNDMLDLLDSLQQKNGKDIKIIYKFISAYKKKSDYLKPRIAYLAYKNDNFLDVVRQLSAIEVTRDNLNIQMQVIRDIASKINLDPAELKRAVQSKQINTLINQANSEIKKYGLSRFPCMIVNGVVIHGVVTYDYALNRINAIMNKYKSL